MRRPGFSMAILASALGATIAAPQAAAAIVAFEYTADAAGSAVGTASGDDPFWVTVTGTGSYDDSVTSGSGLHPLLSFSWNSPVDQYDYACADVAACSGDGTDYFWFDPILVRPEFQLTDFSVPVQFRYFLPEDGGAMYGANFAAAHWLITDLTLVTGGGDPPDGEDPPNGGGTIPEPATALLLGLGLAAAWRARARSLR